MGGGSIMIDIIYKAYCPCDSTKFLSKQQSLGLARRSKTRTAVIDRVRWEAQALGSLGFADTVEFWQVTLPKGDLAERVGFEPTVPRRHNGFRDRPIQPLSHLSVSLGL